MARKRANLSDLLNDLTFQCLFDKFKLIALNRYQIENLPDGIEEEYIMNVLFDSGKALFFRDEEMSFMCLPCDNGQGQNVYGKPLSYIARGFGYQKEYDLDSAVLIKNNKLLLPTKPFLLYFVNKLTEAERTMDVNMKSCKTPVVFACDDKDALTFKRMFQQVDGNVPAIFCDKNLNLDAISVFDTKVKFLCNEIKEYQKSVENDLLTFLGQNNPAVEKRERLVTDEVNSNNQLIESFFELQYESIKESFEKVNEMFGLDIKVTPRQSFLPEGKVKEHDDV